MNETTTIVNDLANNARISVLGINPAVETIAKIARKQQSIIDKVTNTYSTKEVISLPYYMATYSM